MSNGFFKQHKSVLEDAVAAIEIRGHYSAYPEVPSGKIYGENAKQEGLDTFEGYKDSSFSLEQNSNGSTVGEELSPYGFSIGTQYPKVDIDLLIQHIQ